VPLAVPTRINDVWSMDFMHEQLADARSIRLFTVIDDFNREALAIAVDYLLPSVRVVRALDQVIGRRGKPSTILCDNGPEYINSVTTDWARERGAGFCDGLDVDPQSRAARWRSASTYMTTPSPTRRNRPARPSAPCARPAAQILSRGRSSSRPHH
jgi:transposase InsO family protein